MLKVERAVKSRVKSQVIKLLLFFIALNKNL